MVYTSVANNNLLLTYCTEENFNNISCWCGGVMAAPVSHHHSVTCFIIVAIPAFVDIFHPRGGGNSFVACCGILYRWVTDVLAHVACHHTNAGIKLPGTRYLAILSPSQYQRTSHSRYNSRVSSIGAAWQRVRQQIATMT